MPSVPPLVLVADDDPGVAVTLRLMIEALGCRVLLAADGDQAVAAIRSQPVGLLIADLNMPGKNAWDLAEVVRDARPGTPCWVCTGWPEELQDGDPRAAGFAGVLPKPFDLAAIRAVLSSAFPSAVSLD